MKSDYSMRFVNVTFKVFLVLSGLLVFTIYVPYALIHHTMSFNDHNLNYYRSIVLFSLVLAFYSLVICLILLLSAFFTKSKFRPVYFYLFLVNILIFLTITYVDPGGVVYWVLD